LILAKATDSGRPVEVRASPLPPFPAIFEPHISSPPPHRAGATQPAAATGCRKRPKEGVMTRQYEVVYIFDSTLEETAINERLTRFHALLQQPTGSEAPPPPPLTITWRHPPSRQAMTV